jgi:YggT family protein
MQALHFIVSTLFGIYQSVVLVRLLMQLTRADFRNPIARAIVQVTDPLILPLRRVLPPIRRIDTASVVAVLLVTAVKLCILQLLFGSGMPGAAVLGIGLLREIIDLILRTYLFSLFLHALLSFAVQGGYSPAQSILASICVPILNPFRRFLPSIAGLDLSPLWAMIAIQALRILIG